jgi:DNA-binding NarL/FixJ family response regulator
MSLTLWLIEDNAPFRRTVQRVVSKLPNIETVRGFSTFEEALVALTKSTAPDIVLLDVGLPGMTGIEGIAPLKAAAPDVQILILTAFEDDDRIFRAICAGASGYLLKTSTTAEIATAVAEVQRGGSPMTPRIARRVLEMFAKANPPKRDYGLSPREQEILQLLVQGKTVKEAAADLGISFHTADEYIRSVYTKLQVHTRSGAVAKAIKEGLA